MVWGSVLAFRRMCGDADVNGGVEWVTGRGWGYGHVLGLEGGWREDVGGGEMEF